MFQPANGGVYGACASFPFERKGLRERLANLEGGLLASMLDLRQDRAFELAELANLHSYCLTLGFMLHSTKRTMEFDDANVTSGR